MLTLNPAQNMPRSDTAGVCLGEENNGWIIQVNWNELIGYDRVVARDTGQQFASRNFTIGHTGLPFINDKGGTEVEVVDFPSPGKATTLTWSTATQHFEVSGTEDIAPCTGDACEGSGEGTGSRAGSGEGIICEPEFNIEERSHGRTITCESREGLQRVSPGGAPVDWILDADGCLKWTGEPFQNYAAHFIRGYHRFAGGTVESDEWEPDRDANWYLVRHWYLLYSPHDSRWHVHPPQHSSRRYVLVPVPDDEPGNWNQHMYYSEIPFDDRASYHLQHFPSGEVPGSSLGTGERAEYVQYQFYALGPDAAGEGRPCFREIP